MEAGRHDVEHLAEHARQVVADWPDLTPDQRDRLAALLRPSTTPAGESVV